MAKHIDTCPVCKKQYENYDASYRRWCSVGCEAEAMGGHKVTEEELHAVEEHKALAERCGVRRVGDLEDGTGMMCVVPFAVLEELDCSRSRVVPDIPTRLDRIVRDLAEDEPLRFDGGNNEACAVCPSNGTDQQRVMTFDNVPSVDTHWAECPWRRAYEYAHAPDGASAGICTSCDVYNAKWCRHHATPAAPVSLAADSASANPLHQIVNAIGSEERAGNDHELVCKCGARFADESWDDAGYAFHCHLTEVSSVYLDTHNGDKK